MKKIAIVGGPNVGKSVIFTGLTKKYVTVSNYPGTTVEVTRGKMQLDGQDIEIIDTPGMYSLLSITEDERVARKILIDERPDIVIHIVDAKNLRRMLGLTLQLIETAIPIILVLNLMDEARKEGISLNSHLLTNELGIGVVETVAVSGEGIDQLKEKIKDYAGI